MKIHKFISFVSVLLILSFINTSCNSDDDSGTTFESTFSYKHNGIEQPIKDFYAFLDADSNLILSTFSEKLPVEGIEDQIENIFDKRNLTIKLSKFEEGRFALDNGEATLKVDSLFYSYDSQPYKISTLIPDVDSLDAINSFVYVKEIKNGLDLVTGNFRLHRTTLDPMLQPVILYTIEGEFQFVPFTKYQ